MPNVQMISYGSLSQDNTNQNTASSTSNHYSRVNLDRVDPDTKNDSCFCAKLQKKFTQVFSKSGHAYTQMDYPKIQRPLLTKAQLVNRSKSRGRLLHLENKSSVSSTQKPVDEINALAFNSSKLIFGDNSFILTPSMPYGVRFNYPKIKDENG